MHYLRHERYDFIFLSDTNRLMSLDRKISNTGHFGTKLDDLVHS